jgi:hypothetical protein
VPKADSHNMKVSGDLRPIPVIREVVYLPIAKLITMTDNTPIERNLLALIR